MDHLWPVTCAVPHPGLLSHPPAPRAARGSISSARRRYPRLLHGPGSDRGPPSRWLPNSPGIGVRAGVAGGSEHDILVAEGEAQGGRVDRAQDPYQTPGVQRTPSSLTTGMVLPLQNTVKHPSRSRAPDGYCETIFRLQWPLHSTTHWSRVSQDCAAKLIWEHPKPWIIYQQCGQVPEPRTLLQSRLGGGSPFRNVHHDQWPTRPTAIYDTSPLQNWDACVRDQESPNRVLKN